MSLGLENLEKSESQRVSATLIFFSLGLGLHFETLKFSVKVPVWIFRLRSLKSWFQSQNSNLGLTTLFDRVIRFTLFTFLEHS